MDKSEALQPLHSTRRKILTTAVSQLLAEKDFEKVESDCLETLVEMLQCLIVEVGQSARTYCELSGRTVPVLGDVVMSLINMGISLEGIDKFAKREERQIIPMPSQSTQQKQPSLLQAGTKANHPSHIPSFLPDLPDPHAYIRTPTHKQPVTEYEAIREKAATQKRDVERALTRFLSKTSETHSLFDTEDNVFSLIASKPCYPPYLGALNPTDQVFDFEELEYHYLVANRTEDVTSKDDADDVESGNEDSESKISRAEAQPEKDKQPENNIKPNSSTNKAILENPNIDNPYLRAAKLPKRIKNDPSFFDSSTLGAYSHRNK